jgi:hypothetical protein
MVKIQLELTDNEDTVVELHKVINKLKDKRESIKLMIKDTGECILSDPSKFLKCVNEK